MFSSYQSLERRKEERCADDVLLGHGTHTEPAAQTAEHLGMQASILSG